MKKVSKILLPTIYLGVIGVMVVSVVLVLSGVQSYLNEYPNYYNKDYGLPMFENFLKQKNE